MSVRRLAVIVRQLLEDPASALLRAASPDPLWTPGDWIAADQYDLNAAALMGRKATPYPRPGDVRREAERQAQRMTALQAQQERIRRREALAGGDG